jgi:hypothetical protein
LKYNSFAMLGTQENPNGLASIIKLNYLANETLLFNGIFHFSPNISHKKKLNLFLVIFILVQRQNEYVKSWY